VQLGYLASVPIAVFVGLNMIQFGVGSYVEPRVPGEMLSVSPFVVLFSVSSGLSLGDYSEPLSGFQSSSQS
jgi:predicted PurR-regulated permease PerM